MPVGVAVGVGVDEGVAVGDGREVAVGVGEVGTGVQVDVLSARVAIVSEVGAAVG